MRFMKEKDTFTAREVGVLIERLESRMDAMTEALLSLSREMREVKERLSALELRVTALGDVIRIAIPSHEKRITALETHVFRK